jgi:hypothetical protein
MKILLFNIILSRNKNFQSKCALGQTMDWLLELFYKQLMIFHILDWCTIDVLFEINHECFYQFTVATYLFLSNTFMFQQSIIYKYYMNKIIKINN